MRRYLTLSIIVFVISVFLIVGCKNKDASNTKTADVQGSSPSKQNLQKEAEKQQTPNTEVEKKVTIGVVKDVQCQDYCYTTLLSKDDNKEIDLMGNHFLDDNGDLKKEYQNVEVKVTWHTERMYFPEGSTYQTQNIIDNVEIAK